MKANTPLLTSSFVQAPLELRRPPDALLVDMTYSCSFEKQYKALCRVHGGLPHRRRLRQWRLRATPFWPATQANRELAVVKIVHGQTVNVECNRCCSLEDAFRRRCYRLSPRIRRSSRFGAWREDRHKVKIFTLLRELPEPTLSGNSEGCRLSPLLYRTQPHCFMQGLSQLTSIQREECVWGLAGVRKN